MTPDDRIEKNLDLIEKLSEHAGNVSGTISGDADVFYSKWAVLELSGRVEKSMDAPVLAIADEKMGDKSQRRRFKVFVRGIHGFNYKRRFGKLIGMLIGVADIETVEGRISSETRSRYLSSLNKLRVARNELAHTYIKETQRQVFHFSAVREWYFGIRDGLRAYREEIRKILDEGSEMPGV